MNCPHCGRGLSEKDPSKCPFCGFSVKMTIHDKPLDMI